MRELTVLNLFPRAPTLHRRFVLQWHVTNRCNRRCVHCYQDSYSGVELSHEQHLAIVEQFLRFLDSRRCETGAAGVSGHITLTGGEPFMRPDLFRLLEAFAAQRSRFSFSILTNGSLIDRVAVRGLRRLNPSYVQVSVDGSRGAHDRIRGSGDFDRVTAAIRTLKRERVRVLIAFTAHRMNFREFPAVARLGRSLGVSRVWADRLVPLGSGAGIETLTLSETRELFGLMYEAKQEAARGWFGGPEIDMHRALQFLVGGGAPYRCTAGDLLMAVMPNGDLYPCRRMPVRVGNLMETPLADLYHHPLLTALRDRSTPPTGCERCSFQSRCQGGLRCLSYATTENAFQADPGCWRAERRPIPKRDSAPILDTVCTGREG